MIEAFVRAVIFGVAFLLIYAFLSVAGAIPTYLLWNWLMPDLFKITEITFWQAWGINFLCAILFKSSSSSSSK